MDTVQQTRAGDTLPAAVSTVAQTPEFSPTPELPLATNTLPAPTSTPGPISPILFGFDDEKYGRTNIGIVLGGAQGSRWVSAADVHMEEGEAVYVYTRFSFLGPATVETTSPKHPICPSDRYLRMRPAPTADLELFAIGGTWNALPRRFRVLPNETEVYVKAVEDLLAQSGLPGGKATMIQILQVDLDGDQTNEVILAAASFKTTALPSISAGDYSLIVLRTVIGKEVKTVPLVGDYYKANQSPAAANLYTVVAIMDLNGDGRMEIIVRGRRFEGQTTTVYDANGEEVRPVLTHDCGSYKAAQP